MSKRLQDLSTPGVITVHNLTAEESHDYDMPPPDMKHYYHELEPGKLFPFPYSNQWLVHDRLYTGVGRLAATGQLHSDHHGDDMGGNMVTYDNPSELLSSVRIITVYVLSLKCISRSSEIAIGYSF